MWDFILDFQQREIVKHRLTNDHLHILFYIEKTIVDEKFLLWNEPSLYKDILYTDILEAMQNLYIKPKQLKRLITNILEAGYIKCQKIHGGIKARLTTEWYNILSPKQKEDEGNYKYFLLLKWSKMSTSAKQSGQKCPLWNEYYIYNTKNNNISNINNINLDTSNVNNIGSNKGSSKKGETFFEKLKPLFDKYSRFIVEKATLLPSGFDCSKLLEAMERSKFLQDNPRINLEFLLSHYAKIITKDKAGRFYYDDYVTPDTAEQKIGFIQRTYTAEQLDMLFDDINEVNL